MKTGTAIVFGSTGLVGSDLMEELIKSEHYSLIKIFVRQATVFSAREKVEEIITDFDRLREYTDFIKGDDLFICLGTTIKKAGSVSRMEKIDRDFPIEIASVASANSVKRVAVISSLGADALSSNYYLRIKGEMEKGIMDLSFKTIVILRPSILLGKRAERRVGEEIGKILIRIFGVFLLGKLSKYRGIEGKKVAKAMIRLINETDGTAIIESSVLQKI
jgi:uncharacterized protein YbjT (DUF2867 family)